MFGLTARPENMDDLEWAKAQDELGAIYDGAANMTADDFAGALREFYAAHPGMSTAALGKKRGDEAVTSWSWEVIGRLPPGSAENRDPYIIGDPAETGVTAEMLEQFRRYKGFVDENGNYWATPRQMEQWQTRMMDIAAEHDVPPDNLTEEWQRVYDSRSEMYDTMDKQFPGYQELQENYWGLMETNPEAAAAYLEENPTLRAAWDFKTEWAQTHPEYAWYFSDEPRDQAVNTIWRIYNALEEGGIDRRNVRDQLGSQFNELFMDKTTRDYDAISNAQLLGWLAALSVMADQLGIDDSIMRSLWSEAPGSQTPAPEVATVTRENQMVTPPLPGAVAQGGTALPGAAAPVVTGVATDVGTAQPVAGGGTETGGGGVAVAPGAGAAAPGETPLELADSDTATAYMDWKADNTACYDNGDQAACTRLNDPVYDPFRSASGRAWNRFYDTIAPGWRTEDSGFYNDPLIAAWMDPDTRDSVNVNDVVARINELHALLEGARYGDPAEYTQARDEQATWLEKAADLMPGTMAYRQARYEYGQQNPVWARYYLRPDEQQRLAAYAGTGWQYTSGVGGGGGGTTTPRYKTRTRFYPRKKYFTTNPVNISRSAAWYKLING